MEGCPVYNDDRCCLDCNEFNDCENACLLPNGSCKHTIEEDKE